MAATLDGTRTGDDVAIAARLVLAAERLCHSADLRAGWRVLDVPTGSGDGALAAARLGCTATGLDPSPALLEQARLRAAREGLDVELLEGRAASLPFPDASFDAVTSLFGAVAAPDGARFAAELLRVCRPGGTIALAGWTPDGFVGEVLRTLGRPHGDLLALIRDGVASLELTERTYTLWFASPERLVAFLRLRHGPTADAFAAAGGDTAALEAELVALVRRFDRLGVGAVAIPAAYVEAIALRR